MALPISQKTPLPLTLQNIHIDCTPDVFIVSGEQNTFLLIESPDPVDDYLSVKITDDKLFIGDKNCSDVLGCSQSTVKGSQIFLGNGHCQVASGRNIIQIAGNCNVADISISNYSIKITNSNMQANKKRITITIHVASVSNLTISGLATVKIKNIDEEIFSVISSGIGDVLFSSCYAKNLSLNSSGIGDIDGKTFATENALIVSSGTGDIKLKAPENNLILNMSGTGDADFYGNVNHFLETNTGIGDVCFHNDRT